MYTGKFRSVLISLFVLSVLCSSQIALEANPDMKGHEENNDHIRVMMVTDDSTELFKLEKELKHTDSVELKTVQLESRDVGSFLAALDEIQKFNNENSLEDQAQIAFVPLALSTKQPGGEESKSSLDRQISSLRESIRNLHNNGTNVFVPAGDQSTRISGKNEQIVPASFEKATTFSSIEEVEKKDPNKGDRNIFERIWKAIKDLFSRTPLRLSTFSNYGKEVDFGVELHKDLLQQDQVKLDKSTRTAALFGVKTAAEYKAEVLKEAEKLLTPDELIHAMEEKARDSYQDGWKKDPDDFQEPLLNLNMNHISEEERRDRNPGQPGTGDTVEVTVYPAYSNPQETLIQNVEYKRFGTNWIHLYRWNVSSGFIASPRTFNLRCDSSVMLDLRTELIDPDTGNVLDTDTRTVSCSRNHPETWRPFLSR